MLVERGASFDLVVHAGGEVFRNAQALAVGSGGDGSCDCAGTD